MVILAGQQIAAVDTEPGEEILSLGSSHAGTQVPIPVHFGKLKGTRQTFILGAKVSHFVEVFVQFERDLDI